MRVMNWLTAYERCDDEAQSQSWIGAKNAVTPSNATQEIATMEKAVVSRTDRRMLGLSLHGWENTMVASLALAAVFAAIVGICTYCVVQLQREEIQASKDDFEKYKI